ncbi:Pectinesterase [Zea mays]|uniref:Pectinesterase n=1 Tax=Zea mays TaxID=4577 RepID=A0A1D6JFJ1_MAIZE|nr:Pectinesterase [Zea mays]
MANRVTVASVIAAVGIVAVIGTMATVTSADDNDGNMLSSVKVSTVCAFTRYPEKCEQSLKHVVSDTSSPEDVFRDALNVALDEVSTAFQRSAHIGKDAQDKLSRNAMDVCKKLLDDATEDLRALARVKPADVVRHVKDLRVWVSGIMTYVYTCADGFEKPELKEDFIFGNSAALFQNCLMTVRKPGDSQSNMVTAQGRTDPNMPTGIVLQGCRIVPEQALFPDRLQIATYLGRPWKEYARTVVMESTIGDLIRPEGWAEWMGDLGLKTLYYAEYANTGPGAGTSKRVNWPGYHVIGQADATPFTAGAFIDGASWLQSTGTPNVMGFTKG